MCTVTWNATEEGYVLLFNRDEVRTRGPAFPPEIRIRRGTQYISPLDPDGGGTWLGVNEYGLTIGLLNFYDGADGASTDGSADEPQGAQVSRGMLVTTILDSHNVATLEARLGPEAVARYRPFLLFAVDGSGVVRLWTWDGRSLTAAENPEMPLTTSSVQAEEVRAYRLRLFAEILNATDGSRLEALRRFHAHHDPRLPGHSVAMAREDATTVGHAEIRVSTAEVSMTYTAGFPLDTVPFPPISLQRRLPDDGRPSYTSQP
jgi:hypothetical protein